MSTRARRATNRTATTIVIAVVVVALLAGAVMAYRWLADRLDRPAPAPAEAYCQSTIGDQTAELTPEQARNATIITGVAAKLGLAPRAVSIALTTAFQESGLINVDYGDRDSLGLFQQRPSMGWGSEAEVMDPFYSSAKFYEVLVTVDEWDTSDIGDVAQAVQRSGFPDAYDKHIDRARLLASALSGQTPAAWSCLVPEPTTPTPDHLTGQLATAYGEAVATSLTPAGATEDGATRPATLTIEAATPEIAWSAAAFAVAWATHTGVSQVAIGPQTWQASPDAPAAWTTDVTSQLSTTTVQVTF